MLAIYHLNITKYDFFLATFCLYACVKVYWQITLLAIETIQQIATKKNSPAFSIFTCSQDF